MSQPATEEKWNAIALSMCFQNETQMYQVMYIEEGLSVSEIANRLKVGSASLNRRMYQCGIEKRRRGGAHRSPDKKRFLYYLDQRVVMALKSKALSELFGISYSVIYNYKKWKAGSSIGGLSLSASGRLRTMEDIRS